MRTFIIAAVMSFSLLALAAQDGGPKTPTLVEGLEAGKSAVEQGKGCKSVADGLDVGALSAVAVASALAFAAGLARGKKK